MGGGQRISAGGSTLGGYKEDPEAAGAIIRFAFNLIRLYAVLSEPFVPDASATMRDALGVQDAGWPDDMTAAMAALTGGEAFTVPDVMFAKISDDRRAELEAQFAGDS